MAVSRDQLMARYAPRLLPDGRVDSVRLPDEGPVREPDPLAVPTVEPTEQPTQPIIQAPPPPPEAAAERLAVRERPTEPDATATTNSITMTNGASWMPLVTTSGARTIITAPAQVVAVQAASWEQVPNPNPHMLWMTGRYVGAERPNRNGALWSTADLEMGRPTVAHGPLNWLHQDRHVIGSIADARMVPGTPGAATQTAAAGDPISDPHIQALAGIWRWIYPEEAAVVEMASDAGLLAYSMECISRAVQCAGDIGCGQEYGYMEYAQGKTCDHLQQRAGVRRLVEPTFLGGAVIVPPSRPGWAQADATVLRATEAAAEKAFEQAGAPDIPATTWTQMMAGVLAYTGPDATVSP